MNNSCASKELVGHAYAGVGGHCTLTAYLGIEGYARSLLCALAQELGQRERVLP